MSCLAPDQPKRYCKECERYGYPKQEIIVLTTYGGRDTNICNLDGSKHLHQFSYSKYIFDHYDDSDNIEVAKWPKRMAINTRAKGSKK